MRHARPERAFALAVLLAAGCGDLGGDETAATGCPAGFETCAGASDCFASCFCQNPNRSRCEAACGTMSEERVADLDDTSWPAESSTFEQQVLELTNRARMQSGCCGSEGCLGAAPALKLDERLQRSARTHAGDMAMRDYFAHESPEGVTPVDRIREAGFRGCATGENIAAGQPTPETVVQGWLESPGHCANIREPAFTRIGVGYHPMPSNRFAHFWVQNFGG